MAVCVVPLTLLEAAPNLRPPSAGGGLRTFCREILADLLPGPSATSRPKRYRRQPGYRKNNATRHHEGTYC